MFKDMKTYKQLKPGQMGTKRLVEQYGDALLCVRYRYDESRGIRLKTVEVIVEQNDCRPPAAYPDGDMVKLIVTYSLRTQKSDIDTVRV